MNKHNIILLGFLYFIATVTSTDDVDVEMETDIPEVGGLVTPDGLEMDKLKIDAIGNWSGRSSGPARVFDLGLLLPVFGQYYQADEMETADRPEVDETETDRPEMDEIKVLSASLKPARVVDWGLLLPSLPFQYYPNCAKEVLVNSGWPTRIVNGLVEKYKESNWPSGISTHLDRVSNKSLMDMYNCRLIPVTKTSLQAIIVLASDNATMPEQMIANPGFVMFFHKAAIE